MMIVLPVGLKLRGQADAVFAGKAQQDAGSTAWSKGRRERSGACSTDEASGRTRVYPTYHGEAVYRP